MNNIQKFFKGMASFATAFLIVGIISAVVSIIAIAYHKCRNTPCFSYGDISHTMFPR